jgi:hypothetical protein
MRFNSACSLTFAKHFLYPAVKERQKVVISRQDLAAHFAGYNR